MIPSRASALRIGIVIAVAALVGVWGWYASRPAMVWYVIAPLDAQGTRAKVLIPRGWRIDTLNSMLPTGKLGKDDRVSILFEPPSSSIPRWLQRLFRIKDMKGTAVCIEVCRELEFLGFDPAIPADGRLHIVTGPPWINLGIAYRIIKAGNPRLYGVAQIITPDELTFESPNREICMSFRLGPK